MNIRVSEGIRILQCVGEYAIILYVDSSKCVTINIGDGLMHNNYNTDKWAIEYYH
jgi:hypothetical protein